MTQVNQSRQRAEQASSTGAEDAGAAQAGSFLAEIRGGSGAGGEGGGETPMPLKPRRRFPTQHLVTGLVIIAGGGALVAMRQYGMGAGMRFDKADKIDYLEPVAQARTPEQVRILSDLERGVTAVTPEAADINKNPFLLVHGSTPVPVVQQTDEAGDAARRSAEEQRRRQGDLQAAVDGVILNGVMGGDVPLARVNGQIVRVGDTVGDGLLTVTAIQGRSILLTGDGQIFIVDMSQESAPPRATPQIRPRQGK
jgi:hypothetical protein